MINREYNPGMRNLLFFSELNKVEFMSEIRKKTIKER